MFNGRRSRLTTDVNTTHITAVVHNVRQSIVVFPQHGRNSLANGTSCATLNDQTRALYCQQLVYATFGNSIMQSCSDGPRVTPSFCYIFTSASVILKFSEKSTYHIHHYLRIEPPVSRSELTCFGSAHTCYCSRQTHCSPSRSTSYRFVRTISRRNTSAEITASAGTVETRNREFLYRPQ
jgi:hypothetical protein